MSVGQVLMAIPRNMTTGVSLITTKLTVTWETSVVSDANMPLINV